MYKVYDLKLKSHNIINKTLFNNINIFMELKIKNSFLDWTMPIERKNFISPIDGYLKNEFLEKGLIINYKIICDKRNITKTMINDKRATIHLHYQQKNSLNETKLIYTFNYERAFYVW